MKKGFKFSFTILLTLMVIMLTSARCEEAHGEDNTSALTEQNHTEQNQQTLLETQPLPNITWSMERDNLIKLKKLQNDRTVTFFMYVFIEGCGEPIGYYQVNKVSSVNSQLSNPQQIISGLSRTNNLPSQTACVIESPSEDGSYGENGDAVFGFTPEDICIETNMKFICATVPLHFKSPVNRLAIISDKTAQTMLDNSKKAMSK